MKFFFLNFNVIKFTIILSIAFYECKNIKCIKNDVKIPYESKNNSTLDNVNLSRSIDIDLSNLIINNSDKASYSNINDIVQYHIDVKYEINPFLKSIKGTSKIYYNCINENINYITLDTNTLNITSIKDNNNNNLIYKKFISSKLPKDIGEGLFIYINKDKNNCVNLKDSANYLIISFSVNLNSSGINWHSKYLLENKNVPLLSTKGEAINARSYLPCQDTPSAKVSLTSAISLTYDIFDKKIKSYLKLNDAAKLLTTLFSGEEINEYNYNKIIANLNEKKAIDYSRKINLFRKIINDKEFSESNQKNKLNNNKTYLNKNNNTNYFNSTSYFVTKNPISSYLITFVIGELNYIDIDDSICRVYYLKSSNPIIHNNFTKKIAKTFKLCNKYFEYYNNISNFGLFNNLNLNSAIPESNNNGLSTDIDTLKNYNKINTTNEKLVFVILPYDFYSLGMENPYTILINKSVVNTKDGSYHNVIGHEIAHFWSGNLVTCKSWEYFWLNEGITTYLQKRFLFYYYKNVYYKGDRLKLEDTSLMFDLDKVKEYNQTENLNNDHNNIYSKLVSIDDIYFDDLNNSTTNYINVGRIKFIQEIMIANFGYNKAINESIDLNQNINKRLLEPEINGDPYMYYSRIAYDKGTFLLFCLEDSLGSDNMTDFFKLYFKEFAYKSITGKDFNILLNKFVKNLSINKPKEFNIKKFNSEFNYYDWIKDDKIPIKCKNKIDNIHNNNFFNNKTTKVKNNIKDYGFNNLEIIKNMLINICDKNNSYNILVNILNSLSEHYVNLVIDNVVQNTNKLKINKIKQIKKFFKYIIDKKYKFINFNNRLKIKEYNIKIIENDKLKLNKILKYLNKLKWLNKRRHTYFFKTLAKLNIRKAVNVLNKLKKYTNMFTYRSLKHVIDQVDITNKQNNI